MARPTKTWTQGKGVTEFPSGLASHVAGKSGWRCVCREIRTGLQRKGRQPAAPCPWLFISPEITLPQSTELKKGTPGGTGLHPNSIVQEDAKVAPSPLTLERRPPKKGPSGHPKGCGVEHMDQKPLRPLHPGWDQTPPRPRPNQCQINAQFMGMNSWKLCNAWVHSWM